MFVFFTFKEYPVFKKLVKSQRHGDIHAPVYGEGPPADERKNQEVAHHEKKEIRERGRIESDDGELSGKVKYSDTETWGKDFREFKQALGKLQSKVSQSNLQAHRILAGMSEQSQVMASSPAEPVEELEDMASDLCYDFAIRKPIKMKKKRALLPSRPDPVPVDDLYDDCEEPLMTYQSCTEEGSMDLMDEWKPPPPPPPQPPPPKLSMSDHMLKDEAISEVQKVFRTALPMPPPPGYGMPPPLLRDRKTAEVPSLQEDLCDPVPQMWGCREAAPPLQAARAVSMPRLRGNIMRHSDRFQCSLETALAPVNTSSLDGPCDSATDRIVSDEIHLGDWKDLDVCDPEISVAISAPVPRTQSFKRRSLTVPKMKMSDSSELRLDHEQNRYEVPLSLDENYLEMSLAQSSMRATTDSKDESQQSDLLEMMCEMPALMPPEIEFTPEQLQEMSTLNAELDAIDLPDDSSLGSRSSTEYEEYDETTCEYTHYVGICFNSLAPGRS